MSGGWGETNIFCNAKQKESVVELHLKVAENLNSTVTMQIQDNGLSLTPFELFLYNSLYNVLCSYVVKKPGRKRAIVLNLFLTFHELSTNYFLKKNLRVFVNSN